MLPPVVCAVRRLAVVMVAVGFAGGCAGAGPGPAAADRPAPTTTEAVRTVPAPVRGALSTYVAPIAEEAADPELLLFGDSVAVLIADELARELDRPLVVDGVDCRRLDLGFVGPCGGVPAGSSVPPAIADLAPAVGRLEDPGRAAAVVVLANNAALQPEDLDAAMAALRPVPRVWWVTTRVGGRAWQDPNNALLLDLSARDARADVIDWFAASDGRDWLGDRVHPNDAGQVALADLVAAQVRCDCTP